MILHWDYARFTATKEFIYAKIAQYSESGAQMSEFKEISIPVDQSRSYHEQVMENLPV